MRFSYDVGYETPGNPAATGKATPTGHPVAKKRQESVGSGPRPERFGELCVPVVAELQEKRAERTKVHPHTGSSCKALRVPGEETGEVTFERTPGRRLHHRPVDPRAHRQVDREASRRPVPSLPCLEASEESGLELPETRAPGLTEGRGGHRTVEEEQMAPDKKKPKNLGPISFSSMKVGSCLSLTSNAPGPLRAALLSFIISTDKIVSPPSTPLVCLPKEGEWPCTSDCTPKISQAWRSVVSSGISFDISPARSSFCGTGERSTATTRSRPCSFATPGFMRSPSQLMPQSSTPQSMSGPRQTLLYPMVHPKIWHSSEAGFAALRPGYENPKSSSGHASLLANCLGRNECFHYLCKVQ